ncbi:MAG: hemin uptake protein HemP [Pseudomonadota bacterium]
MNEVPTPAASFDAPDMLTYDARELVKDGTRARIVLDGTPYFLRITRAGKLILTK